MNVYGRCFKVQVFNSLMACGMKLSLSLVVLVRSSINLFLIVSSISFLYGKIYSYSRPYISVSLQQLVFILLQRVKEALTPHTHHPINCPCVSSVCVSCPSYRRDKARNSESWFHPAFHLSVMKSFRRWSLLFNGQDGFRLSLLVFGGDGEGREGKKCNHKWSFS